MYQEKDDLELIDLGPYGSFPLQGLNKPYGVENYMLGSKRRIEIELVDQYAE